MPPGCWNTPLVQMFVLGADSSKHSMLTDDAPPSGFSVTVHVEGATPISMTTPLAVPGPLKFALPLSPVHETESVYSAPEACVPDTTFSTFTVKQPARPGDAA